MAIPDQQASSEEVDAVELRVEENRTYFMEPEQASV